MELENAVNGLECCCSVRKEKGMVIINIDEPYIYYEEGALNWVLRVKLSI